MHCCRLELWKYSFDIRHKLGVHNIIAYLICFQGCVLQQKYFLIDLYKQLVSQVIPVSMILFARVTCLTRSKKQRQCVRTVAEGQRCN